MFQSLIKSFFILTKPGTKQGIIVNDNDHEREMAQFQHL